VVSVAEGFNLTRVRLKHGAIPDAVRHDALQPHKSSSETPLSGPVRFASDCFNLTRVRLKLRRTTIDGPHPKLQPHKSSSETRACPARSTC